MLSLGKAGGKCINELSILFLQLVRSLKVFQNKIILNRIMNKIQGGEMIGSGKIDKERDLLLHKAQV